MPDSLMEIKAADGGMLSASMHVRASSALRISSMSVTGGSTIISIATPATYGGTVAFSGTPEQLVHLAERLRDEALSAGFDGALRDLLVGDVGGDRGNR